MNRQTVPEMRRSHSRDAKDLLFSLPSVLSSATLFLGWGALFWSKHLIAQAVFWTSPLLLLYTLGILLFYVRRRNPVGAFLAFVSLPLLGLASYVVCGTLIHGIALQP
jgi:hypothetical protein